MHFIKANSNKYSYSQEASAILNKKTEKPIFGRIEVEFLSWSIVNSVDYRRNNILKNLLCLICNSTHLIFDNIASENRL